MEDMHEAAMACYANMSNDQQQQVVSFFNSIDADGDGRVSTAEYLKFLKTKGWSRKVVPQNLFKHLDADNNGTLDFKECVTFYYMITVKNFSHAHSSFLDNDALLQPNKPRKRDKVMRRTKKVLKFGVAAAVQIAVLGALGNTS